MPLYPGPSVFPGPTTFPGLDAGLGYTFTGPAVDRQFSLLPQYPQTHLIGTNPEGLIVYRVAATQQWLTALMLDPATRDAADRVFEGGRTYTLTPSEVGDLVHGGFGHFITPTPPEMP